MSQLRRFCPTQACTTPFRVGVRQVVLMQVGLNEAVAEVQPLYR
jgi:hypothetical protein